MSTRTMDDKEFPQEEILLERIQQPNFVLSDPGVKSKIKFFKNKADRLIDEQA